MQAWHVRWPREGELRGLSEGKGEGLWMLRLLLLLILLLVLLVLLVLELPLWSRWQ